jgi:hypothetical protein
VAVFGRRPTNDRDESTHERTARERASRVSDADLLNWLEATFMHGSGAVSQYRVLRDDASLEDLIMQVDGLKGILAELASRQENAVLA